MILMRFNVERHEENEAKIKQLMEEGFLPMEEVDMASKTVKELKALAEEKGFKTAGLKKQELIDLLEGGEEDGTDE